LNKEPNHPVNSAGRTITANKVLFLPVIFSIYRVRIELPQLVFFIAKGPLYPVKAFKISFKRRFLVFFTAKMKSNGCHGYFLKFCIQIRLQKLYE